MNTTAIMKYIPAEQILPNTRRNFTLNPLRAQQIRALINSYERNGQKEALSVRPLADGTYELAAGHHRLAAMGGLTDLLPADFDGGCYPPAKGVRVLVEAMDEDQMTRWMIDENSTQPGQFPGVDVDSIAAVVHRVAYLLISGADCPEWMQDFSPERGEVAGSKGWDSARGRLANGTGLGVPIIRAYGVGGMSKHRVEQAIANLKALPTGGMADVIASARAQYEAEVQQHEAEEAKRLEEIKRQQAKEERERKAAEQRRKDLEKQRKAAEQAKDAARQKAVADLKAKAEREERDRMERQRKQEEERKRLAEERATKQVEEQERLRKAKAAEEKMRVQAKEKGVHISLLNLATGGNALEHFKRAVHENDFSVEDQPALWADLGKVSEEIGRGLKYGTAQEEFAAPYIAGRAELRDKLSGFFKAAEHHALVVEAIRSIRDNSGEPVVRKQEVRAYLNRKRLEKDDATKKDFERWSKEEESRNWNAKADRIGQEVGAAFGRVHAALNEFDRIMAEANTPERQMEIMKIANLTSLPHNMDAAERVITMIRQRFNVYRSSVAKENTYDASVING